MDLVALTWGPDDGPIALCLHGFPDTAHGWRKVAPTLVASGYRSRSVKDELRDNLRRKLAAGEPLFPGVLGYERTVVPGAGTGRIARHPTRPP